MTYNHSWRVKQKNWPKIWKIFQHRGKTHDEFLTYIATKYGWTEPQAYWATEFMFRPENHN